MILNEKFFCLSLIDVFFFSGGRGNLKKKKNSFFFPFSTGVLLASYSRTTPFRSLSVQHSGRGTCHPSSNHKVRKK